MRHVTAALASLAIVLGAATAASAQAPAAPIPAAPGALSVEKTTIGDLLADPSAKAVLTKDMPKLIDYPGLDQIKGMTLRDISVYPEAELDDTKLASIQKDLDAAKKP
jgi:hypothetical protein